METKRLILALVLTFAVFFGWQKLFPPPQAPAPEATQTEQQAAAPAAETPASTAPTDFPEIIPTGGKTVTVSTPLVRAEFNTQGGLLQHYLLREYNESVTPPEDGSEPAKVDMVSSPTLGLSVAGIKTWTDAAWDAGVEDLDLTDGEGSITFTGRAGGYVIQRRLTFTADNYAIHEEVRITGESASASALDLSVELGTNVLSDASNMYNRTQLAWLAADSVSQETDEDDLKKDGLERKADVTWGAVENNYFLLAVQPSTAKNTLGGGVRGEHTFFVTLDMDGGSIQQGETKTFSNTYFLGPKERDRLAAASPELHRALNFGWSSFVAEPLLLFLVWVDQYVGNYGVSIIILTIIIKLIFWPLSQKSYKSMDQMKKLQPMIQKLREKHGDDKKAMNQEMMQLYKTYKVNPAGGCLPMVVQIPVFFGLYRALLGAVELRHAGFIDFVPFTDIPWLADLSSKDPFYITPLLMGATMFAQQLMSPSTGDPTQRKMMLLMPVVFTFLFLQFPAGLVVYWLVNNLLSIAQQWMIGRSGKSGKPAKAAK